MNKLIIFGIFCVFSSTVIPATPNNNKATSNVSKEIVKPDLKIQASQLIPTGPTGILSLKIGMSKEAVEALRVDNEVYLSSPLEEVDHEKRFGPGTWFKTMLISPLNALPMAASMFFDVNGILIYLSVRLSAEILILAENQIETKYGSPLVLINKNEEKQCIYRNGSNFKLNSKNHKVQWNTLDGELYQIVTMIHRASLPSCPSNLNSIDQPIEFNYISFERNKRLQIVGTPDKELF